MSPNEIEDILGRDTVQRIVDAVTAAFRGSGNSDQETIKTAINELLISLLAASIITPRTGAGERARRAAARITQIVEASSPPSERSN